VDATGVSLTGALAVTLLAAWLAATALPRTRRHRGRGALALLVGLAVLFGLAWGEAYRRAPLESLLDLGDAPPTRAQAAAAADALLRSLPSPPTPEASEARLRAARRCVAREVLRATGTRVAVPYRVRALPPGALLTFGFAGVTLPWLHEPYVDGALPPPAFLAAATHELVHAAGFAREADTDALAVLAGVACDDPAVRYALALHALAGIAASLPAGPRTDLLARLPERARQDLRNEAAAAARYRVGALARRATGLYGTYLKSQGVARGMADYGRATSLVILALTRSPAP
jgi:hypothetical protein